ncbi:DUF2975 domain-containing protein [Cellulomonas dongxiuzhuiae]|uniref:DUF2975 domain-containing protein n=1 Tax=Cellulomonas dongxiuzhuiae TaxID=2819979 RepID=A0ABX8GJ54_9CELL|nr:DUF2975 domain-containing protein [Cellulomonas dongxiuzhuiae]MBO3094950.1 DUF2975 domain-containing protein [Cellulomonas dongxiuzhuiae]QWC15970.1 DUF2975 domain-containing protein [Cellulomonas dongxiuzhuiae]
MRNLTVLALRVVIALALAGSLFVQCVMAPLLWIDLVEADAPPGVRVPFVVIFVLGLVTLQVCAVCVWRLLTMVRREEVFTPAAFRWVDVIIGAIAAAAVLVFALAVVLAPGEQVAPGIVLLICGAALVLGGIALIVLLLRMLLAQAVDRDREARRLRDELDEVI